MQTYYVVAVSNNGFSSSIVNSFESVAAAFAQQVEAGANQTYEFTNILFLAENVRLVYLSPFLFFLSSFVLIPIELC